MSMMPHRVYVWDIAQHGTAHSLEQAVTMATHLAEQPSEVNPKFILFAQYVQTHFKTVDGNEKRYYVNFVNKVKENKKAALTVDLPVALIVELQKDAWQPVLICMVDMASRLGLAICDTNTQMAFMLPNVVLPKSRIYEWEKLKKDIVLPRFTQPGKQIERRLKKLKIWLKPFLNEVLTKNGFDTKGVEGEFKQVRYTKKVSLGTQLVDIEYRLGYGVEFEMDVSFSFLCDQVDLIVKKINLPAHLIPSFTFQIFLGSQILLCSTNTSRNRYKYQDDIYEFLEYLETIVFPILALAQDIQSLDKLMNGGTNNGLNNGLNDKVAAVMHTKFHRQRLIVARLANNPDFENLVLKLKQQPTKIDMAKASESVIVKTIEANNARDLQWENLVKYLREEVKPLV